MVTKSDFLNPFFAKMRKILQKPWPRVYFKKKCRLSCNSTEAFGPCFTNFRQKRVQVWSITPSPCRNKELHPRGRKSQTFTLKFLKTRKFRAERYGVFVTIQNFKGDQKTLIFWAPNEKIYSNFFKTPSQISPENFLEKFWKFSPFSRKFAILEALQISRPMPKEN